MTPQKEKAKELVEKYDFIYTYDGLEIMDEELTLADRKQCALVAVDEIINTLNYDIRDLDVRGNILLDLIEFWQEVKQEIEKL